MVTNVSFILTGLSQKGPPLWQGHLGYSQAGRRVIQLSPLPPQSLIPSPTVLVWQKTTYNSYEGRQQGPVLVLSKLTFWVLQASRITLSEVMDKRISTSQTKAMYKRTTGFVTPSQCTTPRCTEGTTGGWASLYCRQQQSGSCKTSYKSSILWSMPVAIGSKALAVMFNSKKASILGSQACSFAFKSRELRSVRNTTFT